jgi:hypothetical protein
MTDSVKLFEENKYVQKYLKQAILNDNVELELIFGETFNKNPLDKNKFKNLLEKCKKHYFPLKEENSLDIRTQYKQGSEFKISNVRATITGIENIKKYCKNESLSEIDDVEYIQKNYFKDPNEKFKYFPLKEENYNVRLNLKNEIDLEKTNHKVVSMLRYYNDKKKHFRYKKRFSFLTDDNLFRIDLSVVKSSQQVKGKYNLYNTFRGSNVLNNPEEYELEIEYVGNKENIKEINDKPIQQLFKSLKENQVITKPGFTNSGNIYDPLGLGINIVVKDEEQFALDDNYKYDFDSPRYEENKSYLESYEVSSVKYSQEDYQKLIGKYVRIRDSYFEENNIDSNFQEALKRYHQMGVHIGYVENIYEELDVETKEYLGTKVNIKFYPEIGGISELMVPLKDLYGGSFILKEDQIEESYGKLTDLSGESQPEVYENVRTLNEKNMFDLCKRLLDILEDNVFYLSKIIYNVDILIPFKKKTEILERYKNLTNQRSKYFTFMGPQPVTLSHENITLDRGGSILVNYAVTEKADGDRYELFIVDKHGYLINSKSEILDTDTDFTDLSGEWLIDGEFIKRNKYNDPIRLFMAFDVYWCGFLTPQPVYTYPFVSDDVSRNEYLQRFNKSLDNLKRGKPMW